MADLMMAPEVRDLAIPIMTEYHKPLAKECRIEFLFLLATNSADLGKVKRIGDDIKRVSKDAPDFIITVWRDWWSSAEQGQRIALTDHLLCHCGYSESDNKTFLRKHDFEGFAVEVRRHGAWDPSLQRVEQQFRFHFNAEADEDEVTEPVPHDPETGEIIDSDTAPPWFNAGQSEEE